MPNYKNLVSKLIHKYKKELGLQDWSIDYEIIYSVNTSLYTNTEKKNALIVINKKEINNQQDLNKIIKSQMMEIKNGGRNE
jgi:hypothetical protein